MKNGFTMIELLVGIVIAMLCMIMMLMLFKQISKVSLESMQDAQYDSQIQTGTLVIQKLLQNAGYGIDRRDETPPQNDVLIGEINDSPAIFWRVLDSDPADSTGIQNYKCEALVSENDVTHKEYKLILLTSNPNACGRDTVLDNSTLWTTATNFSKSSLITIKNSNITATTDPIFNFSINDLAVGKNCTPYGISENNPTGYKYITVTAKSKDLAIKDIQQVICLNNIFRSTT